MKKKTVFFMFALIMAFGLVKSSFVCKFNSYIIVLLNLSTMLRAQIAALWQFALALLLCQFPLIF